MPELPEVETTLRGIKRTILRQTVKSVTLRHAKLRWPIPSHLNELLAGQKLKTLKRRAKYLLLGFPNGTVILHLGMSGSLRVLKEDTPPKKHDHVDIIFDNHHLLRFTDPRRFGALLWTSKDPNEHPLLSKLGVEPLSKEFDGHYLMTRAAHKKVPVKSFIMDNHIVTGIGNIYATESLFDAHINPKLPAGKLTRKQCDTLARSIKKILKRAIKKGGTTLRDFKKADGTPGYFSIELRVYGHAGKPCPRCKTILKNIRIGQRSTVYCPHCQA